MVKYNNPFNIRSGSSRWLGKITPKGASFEHFDTLEHGLRAGIKLLINYYKRGFRSVDSIIIRYAPSSENDTPSYIRFVLLEFRVASTPFIAPSDLRALRHWFFILCRAITCYECGFVLSSLEFYRILDYYHLLDYVPQSSKNS